MDESGRETAARCDGKGKGTMGEGGRETAARCEDNDKEKMC